MLPDLSIIKLLLDILTGLIKFLKELGININLPKPSQKALITRPTILVERLHRRYPETNFHIADNERDYFHLVTQQLLKHIDEKMTASRTSEKQEAVCRVGLVCGPLTFNIGRWIEKYRSKYIQKKDFNDLIFVAMNKAAETKSFKFSANYLVTYFSEIFSGSKSFAYTINKYDRERIQLNRERIDILLCSVGSRSTKLSYVDEWLQQYKQETVKSRDFIGDFCLNPIDSRGHLLQEPLDFMQDIEENLDPYPRFKWLYDLKDNNMKIILPVFVHQDKHKQGGSTGKELVTTTLLRSQIVTDCILSTNLAKNLEQSIGKYLIQSTSRSSKSGLCICNAVSLDDNREHQITVHDPYNRLASSYIFDDTLPVPSRESDEIPQLIISELADEDTHFNWQERTGRFEYILDDKKFVFEVGKSSVRRPGQWALITARVTAKYIDRIFNKTNLQDISLLDLGCGCGAIGIFAGGLAEHKVKKIVFSDIKADAVESAKVNADRNSRYLPGCEFRHGDMFGICQPDEHFHIITFNPPFLPSAGIESTSLGIDSGGEEGSDLVQRYIKDLYDHLHIGGWGILVLPDYINPHNVRQQFIEKFGAENVKVEERVILYPFVPKNGVPVAYEINHRAELEANCNYNFEEVYLANDQRYLVFKMLHYIVHRTA